MALRDGTMQNYALTVEKHLEHAAKWHGQTEVVSRGLDGTVSRAGYSETLARARRISAVLRDEQVVAGQAVATLAWNSRHHFECWYGIMGMGAICHTLNPRLPAAHLAVMLDKSGARCVIVSADLAELAQEIETLARNPLRFLVIDGSPASFAERHLDAKTLEQALENADPDTVWGEIDENAACGLCFTSGTTGDPKGVTYTHRASYLHTLRQLQADVIGLTSRDTVLVVVPMFHANAWGLPFSAPSAGSKLVLPGRANDGASLAALIAQEEVTVAVAVPTVWLGMFDYLDASGLELPSLRRIMVGGAPMPESLMQRIESRGISVQTTWGMTELSPLGTATPPTDSDRSSSQSGRPALGLDMLLTDADDCPLPEQRNAEGHLWVRGHSVIRSYLGDTEPVTKNGWFRTGDLAQIDDRGMLTITGRAKDLIKSGGEWINPAEIESLANAHPDVALAAVIGREDEKWSERPVLLVELVPNSRATDEDLLASLKGRIASWWMPDEIIRVAAIPLAATGKIDKLRLRAEFGKRPDPEAGPAIAHG